MSNPEFLANALRGKGVYRSCAWIEGGVFITQDEAKTCCMQNIGGKPSVLFKLSESNGSGLRIIERQTEIRIANQTSKAPCEGCYELKEREWEKRDHLQFVGISGFLHCNLACSYCVSYENNPEDRGGHVLDKLKRWYDEGLLRSGSSIDFGGGESTLHIEFEQIAEFAFAHGMTMLVFTNGTMVSPQLLEGVSRGLARIICSVDAGTPETYRQIKGKPMFHKVWFSLAKYAEQALNSDQVIAKYIVMERNRTRDEIDAFFTEAGKARVTHFIASVNSFQNTQANGDLPMLTKLAVAYVLKRGRLEGTATAADLFSPAMEVEIEDLVKADLQQITARLARPDEKTALELSFSDSDAFSLRANSLLTTRDKFTVLLSSPCAPHALPDRISKLLSRVRAEGGRILPVRSNSGVWTAVQVDF